MQKINSFKKYYKNISYIGMLIFLYILIKSKDKSSKEILYYGYNIIKQLPLNKTNTEMFSSVFDITNNPNDGTFLDNVNAYTRSQFGSGLTGQSNGYESARMDINNSNIYKNQMPNIKQLTSTKRNVSEAKKRYIASSQGWKCANCNQQLNHTFEVDHKVRLEYGGSNEIDNLSALCRNCHGLKTASENINKFR